MIYNIFVIFVEKYKFVEIQARDAENTWKCLKCIAFIRPGAFGARRTSKMIILQKFWKVFSVSDKSTGFAVKSVGFIENTNSTPSRNPCATNDLLIHFESSGHWCGLACQIHGK